MTLWVCQTSTFAYDLARLLPLSWLVLQFDRIELG